ncbi:SDR family NAD(P)-dependent oxidoreductase [Burkholderia cepacia]|uniref:SDR family NAD(P)-dependent oxidoreductase n=1 Tax=Burkholderia cepacia TaxID=292 RepID=UPI001F0DC09E|nr:SDR family NAD(P)-dependent oxidoreductase [Burkholderia cepacia]
MISFNGKTVLVTGGGAGIGRACAEAFGAAGARVAVAEIDPARAQDVRQALEAAGVDALVGTVDVTRRDQVDAFARTVDARFGGLDVLVNNVGDFLQIAKPFDDCTDDDIARLFDANLRQVFVVTRAMLPLLRKRGAGGCIVGVSSIEGFRAIPNCTVYASFKAALTGFTKSLALELGPAGIRVNQIAPETTETPQVPVSAMVAAEHRGHIPRWIPLGRFGAAEHPGHIPRWIPLGRFGAADDIAGAALFLAAPLPAWVTGTTLHVDGGALA